MQLAGLARCGVTGIELTIEGEPRDHAGLDCCNATLGGARQHDVGGQSVQDVKRRRRSIGEARRVDRPRVLVHERRTETEARVFFAAAACTEELDVLLLQALLTHGVHVGSSWLWQLCVRAAYT